MRVIGYSRVSTQEQADSGLGLAAQDDRIRKYCDLYGHTLIGIYVDKGVSAKTRNRPSLQEALKQLRESPVADVGGLVVTKLDRLTRSVGDLSYFLDRLFRPTGPALCVVDEFIQTQTAAGRMVAYMLTTFSQYERELGGERTKAALAIKKQLGECAGACPYGYKADADGKLVENESEQKVLRYIYTVRHPKGEIQRCSFQAIAENLNAMGCHTRSHGMTKKGKMMAGNFSKGTAQRLYQRAVEVVGPGPDGDMV